MSLSVLFFEVRGTRCALPIELVREVLMAPAVTPVPLARAPLRGVVAVHGQVLPVLDVGPALSHGRPGKPTGPEGPEAPVTAASLRPSGDQIVVVETPAGGDGGQALPRVRAALVASRVTRLGAIEDGHSWPPPRGASFVRATVLDAEGPALLLDLTAAITRLCSVGSLDPLGHSGRAEGALESEREARA
jgi:chemotaxis signal transduction protein